MNNKIAIVASLFGEVITKILLSLFINFSLEPLSLLGIVTSAFLI